MENGNIRLCLEGLILFLALLLIGCAVNDTGRHQSVAVALMLAGGAGSIITFIATLINAAG